MFQSVLKAAIKKLGTMVVDRRLGAYVLTVIFMWLGLPTLASFDRGLDPEIINGGVLIVQGLVTVLGLPALLHSWGVREPSGIAQHMEYPTEEIDLPLSSFKDVLEALGLDSDES